MGKKLRETTPLSEELIAQESPFISKKKSKHKHKLQEEQNEANQKRKLEDSTDVNKNDKKKKKKNEKHKTAKNSQTHEAKFEETELRGNGKVSETHEEKREVNGKNEAQDGVDKIMVTGKDANLDKYAALKSFAESKLPKEVLDCCKNFKSPSPIQAHAWPFLLDGRDFIGIAKTGSGKTLAFGVPAIMHVFGKRKGNLEKRTIPICLVLSPTRELADQISDVLCDAGTQCGVKSVCLYGGTSKKPQISTLRSGVDIVIGTPGRLKDLIEMKECHLMDVSFVV
ncbi:DEAD domain-containing protein, partial [Cephalotus follicularis]